MFKFKKKDKDPGRDDVSVAPDREDTVSRMSCVSKESVSSKNSGGFEKDLSDGERAFIRENCGEPYFVGWIETIKDESKEMDKRILAVGQFRLYQIKRAKIGGSKTITKNVHYFEIKTVECHEPTVARITYSQGDALRSMELHSPQIPQIIYALRKAFRNVSFGFLDTDGFALDITEENALISLERDYQPGPCCGFNETYRAWCDLLKLEPHEGLLRYIQYKESVRDQVFDFNELPGIEPHTDTSVKMEPVINTLRHNIHFRSVVLHTDIRKRMADQLADVLATNRSITRVVLRRISARGAAWGMLGQALVGNPLHLVQVLDLSYNKLGGQGVFALLQALRQWPHGMHTLNVARCGLSPRSLVNLSVALRSNFAMSLTLRYLDISKNKLGETASQEFCRWLVEMGADSQLEYFAARDTDMYMLHLAPALMNLKQLKGLDARGCKMGADVTHMKEVMVHTGHLHSLAFTGHVGSNGQEVAGIILRQYLRNPKVNQVTLRLTELSDPTAITAAVEMNRSLHTLDLTGCRFKESDLVQLVMGLIGCNSLEVLILDGCFKEANVLANKLQGGTDGRELGSALSALVASNPNLHHLSLADGYRRVIGCFLQPLGHNTSVRTLNISGNDLGDIGGQALTSCLRTNRHLQHLECDENGFSTNTWLELRWCVEMYNSTLLTLSFPWLDLKRYTASDQVLLQRCRDLLDDINRLLRRNQYKALGHEYVPPKKSYGVALTFEHTHMPLDMEPHAALPDRFLDLQQQAKATAINIEPDDDTVSMKSGMRPPSFNGPRQATATRSGTSMAGRTHSPLAEVAEFPAPPVAAPKTPQTAPETAPHDDDDEGGSQYRLTVEEEDKLFKPYDINADSDEE